MVLLVVDTQEMVVTKDIYQYEEFINRVSHLIKAARASEVEVIYIRHEDGRELVKGEKGFEIISEFAPMPGERIFDKNINSAFGKSGLMDYLETKEQTDVMIVGLQTEYCIDATIKSGFERGFHMIFPEYCNSTVDNEFLNAKASYDYYNHKMWPKRYADCVSFEEAIEYITKNLKKDIVDIK